MCVGIMPCVVEGMKEAQEATMLDTCQFLNYTVTGTDQYGMPVESWVLGLISICGYNPDPKPEMMGGTEVVDRDADLRLPLSVGTVDNRSRLKITHRYGVLLDDPVFYEVDGNVMVGISALRLYLKLLTTGEVI
jgi:hypothetical protein